MAELEKLREDLKFDIWWEKRARKILLICTAICCGLGLIGGVAYGIEGSENVLMSVLVFGIWFGPGLGGAVSIVPILFEAHKEAKRKGDDEQASFWISVVLFFIFMFAGPIGLLIRILRMNHRIKNFEEQLSASGA
jgi:hypothetical protein